MKYLKDYLHLYLGCMVIKGTEKIPFKLDYEELYAIKEFGYWTIIKPILRQLNNISKDENKTAFDVFNCGETTRYLLSIHVDLFGLIDAGLAIDKTTLK